MSASNLMTQSGLAKRRVGGLAIVELTIVLPLVLVLILAAAELGRALWQYNVLSQSVRDGVRHAAGNGLFGSTGVVVITDGLRNEVRNLVVYGNVVGTGAPLLDGHTIGDVTLEAPGSDDILVRASYTYQPLFGSIPTFVGTSIGTFFDFEAVSRMRAL
jgi:hypothetical protein